MWPFGSKTGSGFSSRTTAEEVTDGIDGTGLTAVVTGASSGIGKETTRVLALRGVHAVMAVRNVESGNKVKEQILKEIPTAKVDVRQLDLSSMASVREFASAYISSGFPLNILMQLDLSSMASVREFASEYISSGFPLNILINNAGMMGTPFTLSQDNIELQFATNHVGHFLLTDLLLDTMKKTVRKSNREGRIVIVSSGMHNMTYSEGIRFDKINDESGYNKIYAYGQSKLANILHANELARRLKEEGVDITANSLHPGAIMTNLLRHQSITNSVVNMVGKWFLKNVQQGAATTCYVALHPQVKGVTGEYFMDCNVSKASSKARDVDLAKKLWDFSVGLIKRK